MSLRTNIDLARLEEECVIQPKLYRKVAKELAEAKKDLAEAEAEQEVVEAELKQRIRKNPAKYGVTKTTDAAVKEGMIVSTKYKEMQKKVINAKHYVDLLVADVNTLEHRKRMIEKLVDLHGQMYFAKPKLKEGEFKNTLDTDRTRDSLTRKRKK